MSPPQALETVKNPFFYLAPEMLRLPLVLLATLATIIASQAVISGAFSVTQQAIQLGFMPRLRITHTSESAAGQIYIPVVNWALMVDGHPAGADVRQLVQPGRGLWHRGDRRDADRRGADRGRAAQHVEVEPAIVDRRCSRSSSRSTGSIFGANLLKIPDGGWFPLLVGAVAFTLLTTWAQGPQADDRPDERGQPADGGVHQVGRAERRRAFPGTAVFMTSSASGVPHALLHNLKHNKVLHERVILLTVRIEDVPYVADGTAARDRRIMARASTA